MGEAWRLRRRAASSSRSRAVREPASPPRRGCSAEWLDSAGLRRGAHARARRLGGRAAAAPDPALARRPARSTTAPRRCCTPPTRPSTSRRVVRPALAPGQGRDHRPLRRLDAGLPGRGPRPAAAEVERVARWATADLRPHLTVLLDVEPELGLGRFETRRPDRGRVRRLPPAGARLLPRAGRGRPRALPRRRRAGCRATRSPPWSATGSTPVLPLADRRHDIDARRSARASTHERLGRPGRSGDTSSTS